MTNYERHLVRRESHFCSLNPLFLSAGGDDTGFHVVATRAFGCHTSSLLADFAPSPPVVATRVAEAAHQMVGSALERRISRSAVNRGKPSASAVPAITRSAGSFG